MPSAMSQSPPRLCKWERPPKTSFDLPWADIKVIDISTFDEPGGKEKLAEQLGDAVRRYIIVFIHSMEADDVIGP